MREAKFVVAAIGLTALTALAAAVAGDHEQGGPGVRDAAFGNGLNTVGAANHKILPAIIKARVGDVVDFGVSGFHYIRVYKPGTTDVQVRNALLGAGCTVPLPPPGSPQPVGCPVPTYPADGANVYYTGITPFVVAPTPSPPTNRDERVSFLAPGRYLVVCVITGHFLDGMYAYVDVKANNDDRD